jgi:hypothetical protein
MAEMKTRRSRSSVAGFLAGISDPRVREDSLRAVQILKEATRQPPRMWGSSIVGFGDYHFRYASGRDGDWFLAGFAPRKGILTFYLGFDIGRQRALLKQLGKHSLGKGCLYVKKLDDVDPAVLKRLIRESVKELKRQNR